MSKNSYLTPLYVAVVLKALVMIITWGWIAFPSAAEPLMGEHFTNLSGRIIPPVGIGSILELLIYATFLGIVLKYRGERRRLISGIFIALLICYGLGSNLFSMIWTPLVARRRGADYLGALSVLSSVISYSTILFHAIAVPLFYVSVGRYGMSYHLEEEEIPAPQYQNYQP